MRVRFVNYEIYKHWHDAQWSHRRDMKPKGRDAHLLENRKLTIKQSLIYGVIVSDGKKTDYVPYGLIESED